MTPGSFLDGRVLLYSGDCLEVLSEFEPSSIDSCVTDPPYHLTSIVKRFGKPGSAPVKIKPFPGQGGSPYARGTKGFMGKQWDGGDIAFQAETWAAVFRVLKPGAHLIAFGGTRTYHRMACAIEDAGFEIRDQIQWLYGSGFPKSHDVSKGIDKAAGAEREIIEQGEPVKRMIPGADQHKEGWEKNNGREFVPSKSAAATDEARAWQGWGTALKPACEPIVLARKPLSEGTVAANVLKWGTGALNIDGCRVEHLSESDRALATPGGKVTSALRAGVPDVNRDGRVDVARPDTSKGRWPANVIHDGSEEVVGEFPETSSGALNQASVRADNNIYGQHNGYPDPKLYAPDTGSAARFFYTAKADSDDRLGSKHPTVKPLDLMQYLVRLVTPPGGVVLDPFAGTGTTGEAAWREGFRATLIEREPEYLSDIERRMALCLAGSGERSRESSKAKMKGKPADHGPLFAGAGAL